jgi:hypothetical protein
MTIATTTSGSHHVLSSCRSCILSFWRPWCNGNMSIKRCHLQKEDSYQERWRMMLARLKINGLRSIMTPRDLQDEHRKLMQQPLSGMSHTHRIFFGFVLPPFYERTQASTDKKWCNYVERGQLTHQCSFVLNRHRSPTLAKRSRTTIQEESTK